MYFQSRAEAGRIFAQKLMPYQTANCAIVALSKGAVLVGAQIAMKLHCNMMLLITENINIPGETTPLAAMADSNIMTYNNAYSSGEIDEFTMEYFNLIEQQRMQNMHKLHLLMDASGQVDREMLKQHIIIVVSDGLLTGLSLDVATDFLKPVKTTRIIVVCPVASPKALDRMRLFADEVHCLNVTENYISTDHYYEDNTIPEREGIYKIIRDISLNWERISTVKPKQANVVVPKPQERPDNKLEGVISVRH